MHETDEDVEDLQRLLDESYRSGGVHLRSIFRPDNLCSAPDLVAALPGVFEIHLATVTAKGQPLVAPVDGLFYRGRLWFGLPAGALRGRHLRARPQASASHTNGDFCVIVHGDAEVVTEDHPLHDGYGAYAGKLYGLPAIELNKVRYSGRGWDEYTGFIVPRRIYAQGKPPT